MKQWSLVASDVARSVVRNATKGKAMNRKIHSLDAGYVAERRNPFAPGKVTIYVAEKQGIDVAPDKYAVVCNYHATIVGTTSIPKARQFMKYPEFCEECMKIVAQRTTRQSQNHKSKRNHSVL